MAIIKKKIWPEYFESVASGKKKFELRLNDVPIEAGDTLILEEWDPQTKAYTGRTHEKQVTLATIFTPAELQKFWPQADIDKYGLRILSIE